MASDLPPARRDVRGDRDNLNYGSLEKASIPKYRLAGRGYVLGLGRSFRIRLGSVTGNSRELVAVGADSSKRPRHDSLLSAVPRARLDLRSARSSLDDQIKRQSAYVSIRSDDRSSKRRKLFDDQHPFSIIQTTGEHGSDTSSSADEEGVPDPTDAYEAFRNDQVQQRQRQLMEKTRTDAHDVDNWLALIEHQEAIVLSSDSDSAALSASQRRTVIELRLSLFAQALSSVTEPVARQRLIIGFLREGAKLWDFAKQAAEWEKFLNKDASPDLRVLHLEFMMSDPSTFSFQECLKMMEEYVRAIISDPSSATRDEQVVYLLLRTTLFMKQAGYAERAIAIWQANLELNFFSPSVGSFEDVEIAFEEFWDSELPRIGETGARGWSGLSSGSFKEADMLPQPVQRQPMPACTQPDSVWAAAEQSAQRTWPAKTLDDVDDPYAIVLFSDIQHYLLRASSNETKAFLLDAFLCFNGISSVHDVHTWTVDAFLLQPDTPRPSTGPLDSMCLFAATSHPFATFSGLEPTSISSFISNAIQLVAYAQPLNEDLAEYALALELAVRPRDARKLAKRLLKQRPGSTRLYNAYALVECRLGNMTAAERVWAVTIQQKGDKAKDVAERLLLFRSWIWEAMVDNKRTKAVTLLTQLAETGLKLDSSLCQPPPIEATVALDGCVDYVHAQLSKAYSQSIWDDVVTCTDLLALLQYHIHDRDLQAALAAYQHVLSMTGLSLDPASQPSAPTSTAVEQIHCHRAHLIWLHINTPSLPFRPKDIITTLRSSSHTFPRNSHLRQLSYTVAHKHGAIDRLRESAASATTTTTDTQPSTTAALALLQNITNDLARPPSHGGTEHAIRAAFQRAKHPDSPVRRSPYVQLGHLRWELGLLQRDGYGERAPNEEGGAGAGAGSAAAMPKRTRQRQKQRKQQVQRVRTAWNQAVAACPWVKAVYMACFDEALSGASDGMGEEERREVYESMLARGLRVCVEVQ